MSSTASLDVHLVNIDHPDGVSWNNTTLIKVESVLLFCLAFILKVFVNWVPFENYSICLILYFHLLLFC